MRSIRDWGPARAANPCQECLNHKSETGQRPPRPSASGASSVRRWPQVQLPLEKLAYRSASCYEFLRSTRGEMLDSALDPVALAVGFHRVDRVVVSCPRLEAVYAYAENRR